MPTPCPARLTNIRVLLTHSIVSPLAPERPAVGDPDPDPDDDDDEIDDTLPADLWF